MTTLFLDASAITSGDYQTYSANMTIGGNTGDFPRPMDGTGKGLSSSTASVARAVIDCTSAQIAASGSTLTIAGSATAALGASLTGSALASALVAAINAGSNAVASGVSPLTLQMQYWCWARVDPASAAKVQVFTRCAGADLNYATTSAVAIMPAGTAWTANPTITQFIGGVDGPFAYKWVMGGVFGRTAGTTAYGAEFGATAVGTVAGNTDQIIVRSSRGGVNITQTAAATAAFTTLTPTSKTFVFDDGTWWSGEPNTGKFTQIVTQSSAGSNNRLYASGSGSRYLSLSSENYELKYSGVTASTTFQIHQYYGAAPWHMERCVVSEDTNVPAGSGFVQGLLCPGQGNNSVLLDRCRVHFNSNKPVIYQSVATTIDATIHLADCTLEYANLSGGISPVVNFATASTPTPWKAIFERCSFVDTGNVYQVTSFVGGGFNPGNGLEIAVLDCQGISDAGSGFTAAVTLRHRSFIWRGEGYHRFDNGNALTEFKAGYPYLGTTDALGVGLAQKIVWQTTVTPSTPETLLSRTVATNQLTAGTRTLSLELLVPTGAGLRSSDLGLAAKYVDSSGVTRTEKLIDSLALRLAGTDTALISASPSSASWTLNGVSGVTAVKLSRTTTYPVKQGRNVYVSLLVNNASGLQSYCYADVAIGVA